jgi:glutamate dehydrogenase/leucine dehydrogenase
MSEEERKERAEALQLLTATGVMFVPDPIVSPGGVIAVSHELLGKWEALNVNQDAANLVDRSVRALYSTTSRPTTSASAFDAFVRLTSQFPDSSMLGATSNVRLTNMAHLFKT